MAFDSNVPPGRRQFDQILRAEITAINQRRRRLGREELTLDGHAGHKPIDTVGLALSGGGMRSAAFSLGVLQALNHHNVLRSIDYISSVSGGGYIGSSLTATMTRTKGQFAFGAAPTAGANPTAAEVSDTAAVGHLRNYSNYLIPAGLRDLLTGIAIVIRGLVVNLAWVLAVVLLFAAITILTNPDRTDLSCPDLMGLPVCTFTLTENFGLTLLFALLGLVLFFLWGLCRSLLAPDEAEFRTRLPMYAAAYLVLVATAFFLELQTFLLRGMFDLEIGQEDTAVSLQRLTGTLTTLAAALTPFAALVTLFRQQLADILKATNASARISTRTVAVLGKVGFWVAGAAVPLLIWVAYLYLSYWGIINNPAEPAAVRFEQSAVASSPTTTPKSRKKRKKVDPADFCGKPLDFSGPAPKDGEHTPTWLIEAATRLIYHSLCPAFRPVPSLSQTEDGLFIRIVNRPMVFFYSSAGLLLLILAGLLKPNANSLHRLYRDRLSKAFLFDLREPDKRMTVKRNEASIDQGRDFPQLDRLRISTLSSEHAPYHLINTALNIQGSDYANRRGRNADFFLFSPRYVGSEATGYAETATFEKSANGLDLATAMAISGAAASSNMGSRSITPLRPTLALLNIRLGYWLKNPRYLGSNELGKTNGSLRQHFNNMVGAMTPFLWSEITGRLYENSTDIYLTDGGHIENLGVYELLRRRCKFIIVVDAEADFAMHFPSFVTLQRYARIDLGVIIDVPWCWIKKKTCAWMGFPADQTAEPSSGPHAAIGSIDYGGGERGLIVYIKSSLSGDENDYVRDYGRRYARFPHETTGDQFFSEEQFEVYRALGFHAAHGFLSCRDEIEVVGTNRLLTLDDGEHEAVKAVRAALRDTRPE